MDLAFILRGDQDAKESNGIKEENETESLKAEFSKRLGELEKKLAIMKKDRDEKQAIQENIIKKLQIARDEQEVTIKSLKERLQSSENLLEQKVNKLKELESNSRKYNETILSMKDLSEVTARELDEKKKNAESAITQVSELQAALDKAFLELAEQKKLLAAANGKSLTMVKEVESKLRDEYQMSMMQQAKEVEEREASLVQTIQDLRLEISRINERSGSREDELKNEIQTLKLRLQAAESRNEELTVSVAEMTRPLLRQIEALQTANSERTNVLQELESHFTLRIKEAETQAQQSIEREKVALEQQNESIRKLKLVESDLLSAKKFSSRLAADLETERIKTATMEREQQQLTAKLAAQIALYDRTVQEQKRVENSLKEELQSAKDREETLRKELEASKRQNEPSINQENTMEKRVFSSVNTTSSSHSIASISNASPNIKPSNDAVFPRSPSKSDMLLLASIGGVSFSPLQHVSSITGSSSSLPSMEKLQSLLKQREGEIAALQAQISRLEKMKERLQDELTTLTEKNETLSSEIHSLRELRPQIEDIRQRYHTALELIGEKEELVEELRADIADMKIMYKEQINELITKLTDFSKCTHCNDRCVEKGHSSKDSSKLTSNSSEWNGNSEPNIDGTK